MLLGFLFQVLKVRLIKICKIEPADILFLIVFISFYISRYHFSQIFETSIRIIRKLNFRHKFSFLTDSLTPSHHPPVPLNNRNPLSVMKIFCQCSLILALDSSYIKHLFMEKFLHLFVYALVWKKEKLYENSYICILKFINFRSDVINIDFW